MSTKEIQGKLWSVAPHYWSNYFEPFFTPLYKKTLEQLQPDEDSMLLDAGCGSGLFSHMAISTGAQVVGVDAAPGLLSVARERNPQHNFLEEDLESLPFSSGTFDIVAGFNSFQYAGNFTNALSEAKRVLKTGGRLVIGIWDKPEYSDATTIQPQVLQERLKSAFGRIGNSVDPALQYVPSELNQNQDSSSSPSSTKIGAKTKGAEM